MKRILDINNWRWWQITLLITIGFPVFCILWNGLIDMQLNFDKIIIQLAVGVFYGLIVGGLVEFVRRNKAKRAKNN